MTAADVEYQTAPVELFPALPRRRRRATFRPWLTFLLLGIWFLWPYRSETLNPTNFRDIVVPTAEAARAIGEGQFPIRVAPLQLNGSRYPLFQFYGNLPFTLCALVYYVLRVSPYMAWKIVALLTVWCGGYYMAKLTYQLTRHAAGSIIAGVLLVTAPYFLSDLYHRTAYCEWTAFNLLPAALYFTFRTMVSRRTVVLNIVRAAVFWTFVGLSHNITYLYGVAFGGLFIASYLITRNWRKSRGRVVRLTVAGLLHAGLIVWYVLPQFAVLDQLMMTERTKASKHPYSTVACFLDLQYMLGDKLMKLPGAPEAPEFAFQVGRAILIGVGIAVLGLVTPRGRRNWRLVLRLGAIFVIAFLLVWSPRQGQPGKPIEPGQWYLDAWPYLGPFRFIQFSYRLLVFTTIFGALLTGVGVSFWLPRFSGLRAGRWWGIAGAIVALVAFAGIGYATRNYVPADTRVPEGELDRLVSTPDDFAGLEDYQISNTVAANNSWFHRDLNMAGWQYNLLYGDLQERQHTLLPAPPAAGGLLVEGYFLPPGHVLSEKDFAAAKLNVQVDERAVKTVEFASATGDPPREANAPQGSKAFSVTVPLDANAPLKRPQPVSMWVEWPGPNDMARAVRLTKVQWLSPAPSEMDNHELRAAEFIPRSFRPGGRLAYRIISDKPVLLQMPVQYYPKNLLEVRDFKKTIPYGNIGRYVAVDLPPGPHNISVRFNGIKAANVISAGAWGVVVVVGALARLQNRRDARRTLPRRRNIGVILGVVSMGAMVAGIGGVQLIAKTKALFQRGNDPIEVLGQASSQARSDQSVENLFDGNPLTAWAAHGGEPAKLTLFPRRAGRLRSIELEARGDALYEAWQQATLTLYHKGQKVFEKGTRFTDADKVRTQVIDSEGVVTDQIEIVFSDPVLKTVTGEPIAKEAVNPGYRELRAHWDGRRDATPD